MPTTPERILELSKQQTPQSMLLPYQEGRGTTPERILAISQNPELANQPAIGPAPPVQPQTRPQAPPNFFQRGFQYGTPDEVGRWEERLGRVGRTGVTPGNAVEGASVEIEMKNAERRANARPPLSPQQTEAIMDNWKVQGGRDDLSRTNQYQGLRSRQREEELGSVGGRFRQAGASALNTIGQTAFGAIGTVAPEAAADLRSEYSELLNYDPESRAAKAGQLFGEGAKALTFAKTGAAGMAGIYGAQGFGSTRADVADMRGQGDDISLGMELTAATLIGGAEALSGAVSHKLFGVFGNQLKTMSPMLKQVFQAEGRGALKPIVKSILQQVAQATGSALAEGAEEAATQLITNLITQQTIDEEQGLTEGVGEAGAFGAILSPFGGAGVVGATQTKNDALIKSILPHADNNPVIAEMVAAQIEGLIEEGVKPDLEQIGGLIESAKQMLGAEPAGAFVETRKASGIEILPEGAEPEDYGQQGRKFATRSGERAIVTESSDSGFSYETASGNQGKVEYAVPAYVSPGGRPSILNENTGEVTENQGGLASTHKVSESVQAAINQIEGTAGKPEVVQPKTEEQQQAMAVLDKLGIEAVMTQGGQYAGVTQDVGGKPVVMISENLEGDGLRQAVSHEVSRALEIDRLPVAEQKVLDQYTGRYLARLEAAVKAGRISEEYLAEFKADPEAQARGGAALLIGEVFKSPTAFRKLSGQQPTLVQKIVDAFVGLKQKLTGESTVVDKVLGAIEATMAKKPEIEQLQSDLDKASAESRQNPLTGGLNRRAFDEMIAQGKEEGDKFSVVAFDAANLKAVNDKLGDDAGDAYLREVMQGIQDATRAETDVRRADAFHYGGDEFAVIAWGASKADAEKILRRAEENVGRSEVIPGVSRFLVGNVAEHSPGSETDVLGEATRGLKARKINIKKSLGEATTRQEADAAVARKQQAAQRVGEYIQSLISSGMTRDQLALVLADQTGRSVAEIKSNLDLLFLPSARKGKRVPKLQAAKLRADLARALTESPKVTGRPELANPGKTEGTRRFIDVVDSHLEQSGFPKPESVRQWKREGKKILKDPGRRKEVESALRSGTALQTGAQTVAAIELYNEAADKAMKAPNSANLAEAANLATGYRLGRSETARVMRAGVDQMKTPAQRMAEFARRAMTTPPSQVADAQKRHQDKEGWEADSDAPVPMSPELKAWADDVASTLQKWKDQGINPANLDEAISNSPRTQYRLIRDAQLIDAKHGSGFWSPIQEYYRNSIMSAPLTFIRNLTGGAHAISDLFVVQPLRGAIETLLPGEKTQSLPASVRAITAAMNPVVWARGISNAMMTMYYEQPVFDIETQGLDPLKVDRPVAITGQGTAAALSRIGAPTLGKAAGKAVGATGRVVRVPQLLNMAVDQIVKTIHAHGTVAREAYLIGEKQGLKGQALEGFVSGQLADMGSASWSAAIATGDTDRVAFQADLGGLSTLLVKAREVFPPLGLMFPFIKTPTNIFKESFWVTPGLGLAGLVAKGVVKKGNRAEYTTRAAQQLMGMMAMAALWTHLGGDDDEEPAITGPSTYSRRYRQERRGLEQTQPPMTVKIGDARYSYRNIEPYSTVVGSIVAIGEEAKRAMASKTEAKDAGVKAMQRLSSVYTDLPALKAVGDLAKWLEDPEYYAGRWWLTVGSGWMPNIYRGYQRAQDDLVRESRPTGEPGEKASPGLRLWRQMAPYGDHLAPPRTTIFGTEIRKDRADRFDGWSSLMVQRLLNPFVQRATPENLEGDLLRMVAQWNEKNRGRKEQQRWFVEPHRTVQFQTEATVGNQRVELNEREWHLYMRLSGRMALKVAERQAWNLNNPTVRDIRLLGRIMEGSRENVRKALTAARRAKAVGRADEYTRIMETLQRRLAAIDNHQ